MDSDGDRVISISSEARNADQSADMVEHDRDKAAGVEASDNYAILQLSQLSSLGSMPTLPPPPMVSGQQSTSSSTQSKRKRQADKGEIAATASLTTPGKRSRIIPADQSPSRSLDYALMQSQYPQYEEPVQSTSRGGSPGESSSRALQSIPGHEDDHHGVIGEDYMEGDFEGDGTEIGGKGKRSKRAEQNRRAQQAFRRRREEKMKELEHKAAEIERLTQLAHVGDEWRRRCGELEAVNEALKAKNERLLSLLTSGQQGASLASRGNETGYASNRLDPLLESSVEVDPSLENRTASDIDEVVQQLLQASRTSQNLAEDTLESAARAVSLSPQLGEGLSNTDMRGRALDVFVPETDEKLSSLTIIVAATSNNGIGKQGTLPWKLPEEMRYFKRVTVGSSNGRNTVIMGRKTWDSIPQKYRPLDQRRNVVLSRASTLHHITADAAYNSLTSALDDIPSQSRAFLIGGAQLYSQALEEGLVDRILMTRIIEPEYSDCDAFFPDYVSTWTRSSHEELCRYIGFEVSDSDVQENGTTYRFEMWTKTSTS